MIAPLNTRISYNLNSYNGAAGWGYICKNIRSCCISIRGYTDKAYSDNNKYVLDPAVPIAYMPWGTNSFDFYNGNWENDRNNLFEILFSDNGNGTLELSLYPLKSNVIQGQYIAIAFTYITLN